jgi:integrase
MATITERTKKNGEASYTAMIRLKEKGVIVFKKTATFDREAAAKAWVKRTEADARKPGGLIAPTPSMTLGQAIDKYIATTRKELGRTKEHGLRSLREDEIAQIPCSDITSAHIVDYARRLGEGDRLPQTVATYLSHLGAIVAVGESALGAPLSEEAMTQSIKACKRLGLIAKSDERDRRPTIQELDLIMGQLSRRDPRKNSPAMLHIVPFAAFSGRRQGEITTMRWDDLEDGRILIRDMKDPTKKIGNNVWCTLVPEAEEILRSIPRTGPLIFPCAAISISMAFTKAVKMAGIEDLHFHDLRHEAASRLFEQGWTIPQVAGVTGHKTWQSLQRYSHLRVTGDKLAECYWL